MPVIYDNIEKRLTTGLNETLEDSNRIDACIGYFNLRGWKELADKIEDLPGAEVVEGDDSVHRVCRILVGMQKRPVELLEEHFDQPDGHLIDNSEVNKQKRILADEFKKQLTIGTPTETDERAF